MNKAWNLLKRLGTFGALFIGIQVPPIAVEIANRRPNDTLAVIILLALFIMLMCFMIAWALRVYRQYNQLGQPRGIRLSAVLLGYLAILFSEGFLGNLNQLIYHQSETANNANLAMMLGHSQLITVVFTLSAVFLTPMAEELIFRGALTNMFFQPNSFWPKIILSGLIFSCGHLSTNPISFAIYMVMGMILALVYRKTGDIRNSILLHGLNNLVAMLILLRLA